jgi:hypothetical protein
MSTLRDLLQKLDALDNDLSAEIDPAELVGEIRDKVDAIKHVLDRMDNFAEFLKSRIEPLAKARSSVTKNIKRLEEYVKFHMQEQHLERLPGEEFYIRLIQRAERLVFSLPPGPDEALRYFDYVKIQRIYSWDEEKIHNDILSGVLKDFPYAKFQGSNYIRFFTETANDRTSKRNTAKKQPALISTAPKEPDPSGPPEAS